MVLSHQTFFGGGLIYMDMMALNSFPICLFVDIYLSTNKDTIRKRQFGL